MRALVLYLLTIACVQGAAAAFASDPDAGDAGESAEILRAEEIVVETEVLVPAEIYLATPVETEVFTAADLRTIPATNPIEALDSIPGIRVQSQVQGQRGAVRIDGLPPEFTEILVNGQRYSGENGEAIDLGDQLFANIERVEILRGPQAIRYSPRAAGGVINFITKSPPTEGFRVSGEAGGGDQEQAEFESSLGWGNHRVGLELTYDFNQIGGFNDPNQGSDEPDDGLASPYGEGSLYRTHDFYSTFVARPLEWLEFETHLGYRHRDDAFAVDNGPVEARKDVDRWLFSQEGRAALTDSTQLYGIVTYSNEKQDSTVAREFQLTDEYTRVQIGVEHAQEWGSTLHVLTVGGDIVSNGIEVDEGDVPPEIDNPDFTISDVDERYAGGGAFAILESDLTSWLESELGLRYEMRQDFKPELLPQAAVLVTPWRWDGERAIKFRLSAGRAVRYPTLRELYQPIVPQQGGGYFLEGNQDLDSETVWAFRGGIEANPKRWISGSVVGFYSKTRNRIRAFDFGKTIQTGTTTIPPNPALCPVNPLFCSEQITPVFRSVFENANLDDFRSYGVEARLEFRPYEFIELVLGYTWNRTEVDDSNVDIDELPNSPRHIANGRLQLTAPVWGTIFTARGEWRDRAILESSGTGLLSFATNEMSNSSFDLDFRLIQPLEEFMGVSVDVFADLQNATDNRVVNSSVVRGRSFLVGLKWNFN
jgi:outer membrane receptor protein involved in Fe transport